MVYASRDIRVQSWVQISKHQRLFKQVRLAYFAHMFLFLLLKVFILLTPNLPHLLAIQFSVLPRSLHCVSHVVVATVLQEPLSVSFYFEQIVLLYYQPCKLRQQILVALLESGVQGVGQIGSAAHFIAYADIAISNYRAPHFVGHVSSPFVTNPSVKTTSARKNPKYVLEVEVFNQNISQDNHSNFKVLPTLFAHICPSAAAPDIIIVVHINIKHHFFMRRYKGSFV